MPGLERLPLRRYPLEALVLVLVAFATLAMLYPLNTQDATRLALTESVIERGSLNVDPYHSILLDRAYRDGHWYSDKAPGMSFLAIPAVGFFHLVDVARGGGPSLPIWLRQGQLWALRFLTSGLGLLLATFLVGRTAEGLRSGSGAPVAVTFALGTIAGPLGAIMMEHDVSAAIGFAAFLVAARGRRTAMLAGLLAGLMILFDYTGALVAAVVGVYIVARYGLRPLLAYAAGMLPAAVLLGAYDQAAFGSPFHVSYRYVTNQFTDQQRQGFFGIAEPTVHGFWLALFGQRGLLVISPVLLAAVAGLVVMARRGLRAEAAVCLAVAMLFLVVDAGYFDPYGGALLGPRFFVPALPFLAVGLADAYRRWPIPTGLLALASIVLVSLDTLTWEGADHRIVWTTIWSRAGAPRPVGVALVLLAFGITTGLAGTVLVRTRREAARRSVPST